MTAKPDGTQSEFADAGDVADAPLQVMPDGTLGPVPAAFEMQPLSASPDGVMRLMAQMVASGRDVDQMSKFADLIIKMRDDQARQAFSAARSAMQAECPAIVRNREHFQASRSGSGFTRRWADTEQILTTLRPMLDKHGFSISWDQKMVGDGSFVEAICKLQHQDGHSESVGVPLPTASSSPGMSEQDKFHSAYTRAQRLALNAVLGLTETEADPDAPSVEGMEPLTDEQQKEIVRLLDETRVDFTKFCDWVGLQQGEEVGHTREIQQRVYPAAVAKLEATLRKTRGES